MMSERKPRTTSDVAGIVLLILIAGYVGAYYVTVEPGRMWVFGDGLAPVPSWDTYPKIANEQTNPHWQSFFAPIHDLDRHVIRRRFWNP